LALVPVAESPEVVEVGQSPVLKSGRGSFLLQMGLDSGSVDGVGAPARVLVRPEGCEGTKQVAKKNRAWQTCGRCARER
jgi:hypothetical protein